MIDNFASNKFYPQKFEELTAQRTSRYNLYPIFSRMCCFRIPDMRHIRFVDISTNFSWIKRKKSQALALDLKHS